MTNGTLIDDSVIRKLAKIKNLALLVSLEGVGEMNDKIRGKGIFKIVDRVIRKLRDNNIYVEISTTINAQNIDHYREMVKYSQELDIPCNFNLFKPFKRSHPFLVIDPDRYFRLAEEIFQNWDSVKSKASLTSAPLVAKLVYNKKRDECRATITGLTVDVDVKMIPCSTLQAAGYYDNVELPEFDENFIETWNNNQYFQEFRKRGLGECQARSYIFSKDINGKDLYGITAFNEYQKRENRSN